MLPYSISCTLREVRSRPEKPHRPDTHLSTAPLEALSAGGAAAIEVPSPPGCSPQSGPARGACPQNDGSPDGTFRSLEVIPSPGERPLVPEGNASRVLPLARRKTPPASAADMTREFLASPEYTVWEGAAGQHTAQPPSLSCPARGGALCSRRGGRAGAWGSAARGAASAA